jgi:hypothetical protein
MIRVMSGRESDQGHRKPEQGCRQKLDQTTTVQSCRPLQESVRSKTANIARPNRSNPAVPHNLDAPALVEFKRMIVQSSEGAIDSKSASEAEKAPQGLGFQRLRTLSTFSQEFPILGLPWPRLHD